MTSPAPRTSAGPDDGEPDAAVVLEPDDIHPAVIATPGPLQSAAPATGNAAPVRASLEQLAAFTTQWLANRQSLSDHTRSAYRSDVHQYLRWCTANKLQPLSVKFTHINDYAGHLRDSGMNKRTVGRKLSALSSWYDFLHKMEAVTGNPVPLADRPKWDRHQRVESWLNDDQARRLLDAIDDAAGDFALRDQALMYVLVILGPRASECINIDIADLGRDPATGKRRVLLHGKGGKTIPRLLPDAVADRIHTYLEWRAQRMGIVVRSLVGPVFVSKRGKRLRRNDVARILESFIHSAGLDQTDPDADAFDTADDRPISPHSLRRSMATKLLGNGEALTHVQAMMGHASPDTTILYDLQHGSLERDRAADYAAFLGRGNSNTAPSAVDDAAALRAENDRLEQELADMRQRLAHLDHGSSDAGNSI